MGASSLKVRSSHDKSVASDKCLSVEETTIVRLITNIPPFSNGTKFSYRIERWYYPEFDFSEISNGADGVGGSQLWYIGATKEQVPRWMYALLLRADLYKGKDHKLKELFELEYKATSLPNDTGYRANTKPGESKPIDEISNRLRRTT